MKRRLLISHRPRRRRVASALAVVMFFSAMIAFSSTSLIGYGMFRRSVTARQVLYNAELATAESLMERAFANYTFLANSQSTTADAQRNCIPDSTDVFVRNGLTGLQSNGFLGVVVGLPPANVVNSRAVTAADALDRPELADYIGYNMIISDFTIMAGARAVSVNDPARDMAMSNYLKRPGVYVSRKNTTYSVPLLAYAIFYENRLEIDGGADLDVVGRVHTNDDLWLTKSSGYARYHDRVTAAGHFIGGLYHWGDWSRRTWSSIDDINISFNPSTTGTRMSSTSNMRKARQNATQQATDGSNNNVAASAYNNGWLSSWNYGVSGGNPAGRTNAVNSGINPVTNWTANPDWATMTAALFRGPNAASPPKLQDSATGAKKVKMPIADSADPYLLIESPNPAWDAASNPYFADKKKVNLGYRASIIIEPKPGITDIHSSTYKNATTTANGSWPANTLNAYRLVKDPSQPNGYRRDTFSLTYRRTGDAAGTVRSFVSAPRIYNGREQKWVTMIDVNTAKLAEYLDTASTSATTGVNKFNLDHPDATIPDGIIFVDTPVNTPGNYASGQRGVPSGEELAARISNGTTANLQSVISRSAASGLTGLSFASSGPMYTLGNLNEQQADEANPTKNLGVPLMIAGDSINILSPAFNDSLYNTTGSSNNGAVRGGSNTITNAVFVGGNVPTTVGQYGGGAENYFRYLEGGTRTHFYRGSVINLWESRIATAGWDKDPSKTTVSSGYYGAPRRNWGWDVNYANSLPPPGIPSVQWEVEGDWDLITAGEVRAALTAAGRTDGHIALD